jgi:hypothetical protein
MAECGFEGAFVAHGEEAVLYRRVVPRHARACA